jgi:hypothetical protein
MSGGQDPQCPGAVAFRSTDGDLSPRFDRMLWKNSVTISDIDAHVITELGITGRSHGLVDLQKNLSLRELESFRRASIEFVLRYDHKLEEHLKSSNVQLVLTQDIEHLVERCVFH